MRSIFRAVSIYLTIAFLAEFVFQVNRQELFFAGYVAGYIIFVVVDRIER